MLPRPARGTEGINRMKTFRWVGTAVAVSVVLMPASGPGRADESAGAAEWLSLGSAVTQAAPSVSVGPADETGQAILVTVPGVWKAPVTGPDGQAYVHLSAPGCGVTAGAVGQPSMPFKGFLLEVPYGVDVSVALSDPTPVSLGRGSRVYPLQPPEPDNGAAPPPFQLDAAAYANDAFVPVWPVVIDEPGFIRGRRVVFVKVFPLQYNAATGEVRGFNRLALTVTYRGQADPSGEFRKARLATAASEAMAQRVILNYEPAQAVPVGGGMLLEEAGGGNGADYLIIVGDALYDEVLPLAEWKRRKGFVTYVMRMSEVGSTAADVRAVIQAAYETWTPAPSYVLLVGDAGDVPPDYFYGELGCASDHPYACVDGADYYPDLTLGRLPVGTAAECTTVVNKILAYEKTPAAGSWCEAFLSAGYFQDDDDDGWADRWFMETCAYGAEFLTSTVGMTMYTAWCTYSSPREEYHYRSTGYPHRFPYPDPVPSWVTSRWTTPSAARSDVTAAINAGVSFVMHRDHGSETGWGEPYYGLTDISGLSNGAKTPVVFSVNCQTGSFHRAGGDCFCEAFIKESGGGAVGIVGATRDSYSGYNDLIAHGIMTSFWPSYDATHTDSTYSHSWRPAEALTYGKYYMFVYRGTGTYTEGEFYMFHWFGDPEMSLRTEAARALSVTHPQVVGRGAPTDVMIAVECGGVPLSGARAAISNAQTGELWSELADANGTVTFEDLVLTEYGDYDVVVTSRNGLPYEGTITAGPASVGSIRLDRGEYSCAGTIGIQVIDADLTGAGTQEVTVTTGGGDSETVTLTETDPNGGIFGGTIPTGPGQVATEDGVVQIAHGQTITATYQDEDIGTGDPATVQDTATADCQPPVISNVQVVDVRSNGATIAFETDVVTTGRVRCGTTCGGSYPVTGQDQTLSTVHTVDLANLFDETAYVFVVDAWDAAGNLASDDNGGACYAFETPFQPEYFTELFDANDNDLAYRSVTFTPDGSAGYYSACCEPASDYHTDPNGGTVIELEDNDAKLVLLTGGAQFTFYGVSGQAFYVGSNGYITAPTRDYSPVESLSDHFSMFRIAGLFDDLDPAQGGTVSWKQTADLVAVTFENVPEHDAANSNSFQIEILFDGRIRLTWLQIDAADGLVGFSQGQGVPADFAESDMTAYPACGPLFDLTVEVRGDYAHVDFYPEPDDPNRPAYPTGTVVTLTMVMEDEGHEFSHWEIYDPNYPGDKNYAVIDTNLSVTVVMDGDQYVLAKFKCFSGEGSALLPLATLMGMMFLRRRR